MAFFIRVGGITRKGWRYAVLGIIVEGITCKGWCYAVSQVARDLEQDGDFAHGIAQAVDELKYFRFTLLLEQKGKGFGGITVGLAGQATAQQGILPPVGELFYTLLDRPACTLLRFVPA